MPKPKKLPPVSRPDKPPQTIRGGFIVVRRDVRTSRLLTGHGTAYEHASSTEAKAQATVLAERFNCEFAVFCEVASALPPSAPSPIEPEPMPVPEPPNTKGSNPPHHPASISWIGSWMIIPGCVQDTCGLPGYPLAGQLGSPPED